MTVEQAKKLLDGPSKHLSDEDIQLLINRLKVVAQSLVETVFDKSATIKPR